MELYLASERIGNLTEPPQLGLLVSDCNKTINLRHTHYFDNPVHVTKNCRDLFPTLDVKHQYMTPGISYINESVHHIITETREAILQLSINIHQIISDQIPDIQEADLLAESFQLIDRKFISPHQQQIPFLKQDLRGLPIEPLLVHKPDITIVQNLIHINHPVPAQQKHNFPRIIIRTIDNNMTPKSFPQTATTSDLIPLQTEYPNGLL